MNVMTRKIASRKAVFGGLLVGALLGYLSGAFFFLVPGFVGGFVGAILGGILGLMKEHRAGACQSHEQRRKEQDRREKDEQQNRQDQVETTLPSACPECP